MKLKFAELDVQWRYGRTDGKNQYMLYVQYFYLDKYNFVIHVPMDVFDSQLSEAHSKLSRKRNYVFVSDEFGMLCDMFDKLNEQKGVSQSDEFYEAFVKALIVFMASGGDDSDFEPDVWISKMTNGIEKPFIITPAPQLARLLRLEQFRERREEHIEREESRKDYLASLK